jgi:hypothetical protein
MNNDIGCGFDFDITCRLNQNFLTRTVEHDLVLLRVNHDNSFSTVFVIENYSMTRPRSNQLSIVLTRCVVFDWLFFFVPDAS